MDSRVTTAAEEGQVALAGLTKRYGSEVVVADIATTIAPGEFFSLLGPSGSGKTTTLMMIAGFVAPDAGSIRIGGRDVTGLPPQRRGLGMVFQNYALFPHLSVFENVAFPLKVRKLGGEEIRERVEKTLQTVRLREFTRRLPRELSGGQQQRVALARAIVFHPRVVLMDEPLGALDKNLRYQMQLEIKEIQERLGMTAVYVTHDQEEAMNMSDRIAIMNRGRIEQVGRPREVYEEPGCVFVAKFLGEANLIRGRLAHDGDDVRLRADSGGIFLVERGARVVDSRAAHLFVRPEKVGLAPRAETPAPEPGTNRIAGTVRRVSFLGNVVRYGIEIGEAELLLSDAQNGSGKAILPAGTEVTASWRGADARVLEDG